MSRSPILREARIQPEVIRYHLTGTTIFLLVTVVGILLLPIVLPIVAWVMKRYYERLSVVLTRRDLKVERGIFQREEKSIPLEKITDLAVYQGPLMRFFNLKGIRIETAGQSAQGALVTVLGIENVDQFRDAVLDQRDRVSEREEPEQAAPPAAPNDTGTMTHLVVLEQIRDSLTRIERHLASQPTGNGSRDSG
jgi:putative membrane protein